MPDDTLHVSQLVGFAPPPPEEPALTVWNLTVKAEPAQAEPAPVAPEGTPA